MATNMSRACISAADLSPPPTASARQRSLCTAWPPEQQQGEPSGLGTTQPKLQWLAEFWLAPMHHGNALRPTELYNSVGQPSSHEGDAAPIVPTDPAADHRGCIGCTAWVSDLEQSSPAAR